MVSTIQNLLRNYENKQRRSSSSVEELANTLKNLIIESQCNKTFFVYISILLFHTFQ